MGLWRGRTLWQSELAGDGGWNKEMGLAEIFAKFLPYRCVQVVVPKSSVPWCQLSTVCRLRTDWIPVSIIVNHNVCLGEIYIAIPRQLVDTKKTFGRLYLTVLDFSLLQSVTHVMVWLNSSHMTGGFGATTFLPLSYLF